MELEHIDKFCKRIKYGRNKVFKFYKNHKELKSETRLIKNKRMVPVSHEKYFNLDEMIGENKALIAERESTRNLIDCLIDKNSLVLKFWQMQWHFFVTIAYKLERNKKSCYRQIFSFYDDMIDKYGNESGLNLFFTTEPFTNRKGFHNHLVIGVGDVNLRQQIAEEIRTYFSYDRVDIKPYDRYKAGLFYMSKEGLVGDDWDILGNDLKGNKMTQ